MEFCFSFKVCSLRIFRSIKMPKVVFFSSNYNSRPKFILSWSPLDSENSTFIVAVCHALVVKILAHGCFTKIRNSIVGWVAVDVVYKFLGKFPIHVKPRKSVGFVASIPNDDMPPPLAAARSSHVASACSSAGNAPSELSGFRVVIEKLSQMLGSKFFFYNTFSHYDSNKVGLVRAYVAVQTPHRLVQFTGACV